MQRQNGRHFPDNIFNCIFLNETVLILITFSPKFVSRGLINNIPALVPIMAWRRPGDKPLPEPMMASLLMHICITRPQWVKHMVPILVCFFVGIDYSLAPEAMVGHVTMHEWGLRPHECMVAWSTMAPGAKPWSISHSTTINEVGTVRTFNLHHI